MRALLIGLLLLVGCAKEKPLATTFSVSKPGSFSISAKMDPGLKASAKEYKSAIAVATDGQ